LELIKQVLSHPIWQGVAGVAQIAAAVLALIAVRQATRIINLAEDERRKAIEPAWEIVGRQHIGSYTLQRTPWFVSTYMITLRNVGAGPARQCTAEMEKGDARLRSGTRTPFPGTTHFQSS
jgi:hypothetical protein